MVIWDSEFSKEDVFLMIWCGELHIQTVHIDPCRGNVSSTSKRSPQLQLAVSPRALSKWLLKLVLCWLGARNIEIYLHKCPAGSPVLLAALPVLGLKFVIIPLVILVFWNLVAANIVDTSLDFRTECGRNGEL